MNFAALVLALKTFLVANWLNVAIKVAPTVFFAALLLAEWLCDTTFGKIRLVMLMLSGCVLWLDLSGKLPVLPVATPKS
jgi:hypothetical protein